MTFMRKGCVVFVASSALSALGCGSATEADPHSSSLPPVTGESTQNETTKAGETLLASLSIEAGHTVNFYQLVNGQSLVTETGLPNQDRLVDERFNTKPMAEVYKALQPSAEVPAALIHADKVAAAWRPVASSAAAPPPESASTGTGPRFYTPSQQTWFKNTWCHNDVDRTLVKCLQGSSSAHSGWILGGRFGSVVFVGSEAAQAATFTYIFWTGSSAQTLINQLVKPGFWFAANVPSFNGSFNWYQANLDNAGANTLVDNAIKNCGEAGEFSCGVNCGSGQGCDPNNVIGCQLDGSQNGTCYN